MTQVGFMTNWPQCCNFLHQQRWQQEVHVVSKQVIGAPACLQKHVTRFCKPSLCVLSLACFWGSNSVCSLAACVLLHVMTQHLAVEEHGLHPFVHVSRLTQRQCSPLSHSFASVHVASSRVFTLNSQQPTAACRQHSSAAACHELSHLHVSSSAPT